MMLPHTDDVMAMEATFLRGVIVVASVMLAFVAGAQQAVRVDSPASYSFCSISLPLRLSFI
jgi:hypothetical protein